MAETMKTSIEGNSKIHHILLLTDSRGRGMDGYISNSREFVYTIEVYPGATLERIKNRLLLLHNMGRLSHSCDAIFIFAGICNVTRLVYSPYRAAIPKYTTDNEIFEGFKSECEQLINGVTEQIKVPIIFAPIVGIDLVAYAKGPMAHLYESQPIVDSSILLINNFIRTVNGERGLPTPNTSTVIHRCRGRDRGYRTHYCKLTDGCHPNGEVMEYWAQAFVSCCANLFG